MTGDVNKKYILRLFIVDGAPNSMKARTNLSKICQEFFKDEHIIELVDIKTDFRKALKYNIFVTPTLIRIAPGPEITIVGNLNDTETVVKELQSI